MIKNLLASLFILIMGMQMSAAQGLEAGDMVFAFCGTVQNDTQELLRVAPALQAISAAKMDPTPARLSRKAWHLKRYFRLSRISAGSIRRVMCRRSSIRIEGYGSRIDYHYIR